MKNILNNKYNLSFFPTPMYKLKNLSYSCPDYTVFIKRDDYGGLATGGSYTRKPEYLINQDLDEGCHTVVTASAQQLNNCRQTATVCTVFLGYDLPENGTEDSCSILPLLEGGKRSKSLHKVTVHHSMAVEFAIRLDKWKSILCQGSGTWSHPNPWEESEDFPELHFMTWSLTRVKKTIYRRNSLKKLKIREIYFRFILLTGEVQRVPLKHNDDPP